MDHSFFKDRLSGYFDNELPAQEKQVVEEHLQTCAECRAELAKLQQLEDAVNRHAELSDSDYWEKSARKIESRLGFEQPTAVTPVRPKWYERGVGWKALAAAASIGVLAYIGINSERILKRQDLELGKSRPKISIPKRIEPVADGIDSAHFVSPPVKQEEESPRLGVKDKKAMPEKDAAIQPSSSKPEVKHEPEVASTPEQIQPTQDINLSEQLVQDTEANYSSRLRSKISTSSMPDNRAAAAPSALVADSGLPIADEFVGKFEGASKETAIAQIDTAVSDTMLTWWRKKRDDLLAVQKSLPGVDAFSDLRKMATPTALKQTEKRAPQMTRTEIEKQLLEAWFNTAKLTEDPDERTNAVSDIKRVADNIKSPNHKLASSYLKQLTAK